MRHCFSGIPIASMLIAGSVLAQTAEPDMSRNAAPIPPDSSRNSQHCTTTGLSADAATSCPDDVLKIPTTPGASPVVDAPAGGPAGIGSAGTPSPPTGASSIESAPEPANAGGVARK